MAFGHARADAKTPDLILLHLRNSQVVLDHGVNGDRKCDRLWRVKMRQLANARSCWSSPNACSHLTLEFCCERLSQQAVSRSREGSDSESHNLIL